ncbi:MAG: RNHCP domain-containing protein [Candidatus Gracilibacteria bacterium]|nr:RNHCP domain-containing protein [Candidatus Gracilibacteria bacterium]MDD2909255.1 RNHCP domain-containing protein [Candidatus Gracilibacteria bacterium]
MGFIMINEEFECENCHKKVSSHPESSARNHCPFCLFSKHLDDKFPGDRASDCLGLMEPFDLDFKKNKGYMIKHKCLKCGKEILNKVASDDNLLDFTKERNKKLTAKNGF